ncbi:hypothetical protein [Burkholderia vietnamiensis]|uniref:hypothetical protein n=1 Tax=Burkholderia vietnamiensis TaxID=60552 RepID=UPI001D13F281|nr:hypothetical protein [Burkholderia vietnamiensis]UEC01755.1 hypothetical protein LK462_06930 [Burkholderia vietnamiensis]
MYHASQQVRKATAWLPVQALTDIEFLVKECEVLTGQAGRCFVVAGADRLAYRVHWHPLGFKVERLDDAGCVLDVRHLRPREFEEHSIAEALANGQLFTVPVLFVSKNSD